MSMASVDFGREWDLNAGAGSSSYVGSTVRAQDPVSGFCVLKITLLLGRSVYLKPSQPFPAAEHYPSHQTD